MRFLFLAISRSIRGLCKEYFCQRFSAEKRSPRLSDAAGRILLPKFSVCEKGRPLDFLMEAEREAGGALSFTQSCLSRKLATDSAPRSNGAVCRAMPVWKPVMLNARAIQISATIARFRGNVRSCRSGSMPLIVGERNLGNNRACGGICLGTA